MAAMQDAAGTAEAEWTPPAIPQPLPTPGGPPPTPVGAAAPASTQPEQAAHPASDIEGSPEPGPGTPSAPGAAVEEPGAPAVPAGELATPGAAERPPAAVTVTYTPDFGVDPDEVTIKVGEAVAWLNAGRSPQTVTCDPARIREEGRVSLPDGAEPWDSGVLNTNDVFTHTFEVAGEYVYASMNRAVDMSGRVIVQE